MILDERLLTSSEKRSIQYLHQPSQPSTITTSINLLLSDIIDMISYWKLVIGGLRPQAIRIKLLLLDEIIFYVYLNVMNEQAKKLPLLKHWSLLVNLSQSINTYLRMSEQLFLNRFRGISPWRVSLNLYLAGTTDQLQQPR